MNNFFKVNIEEAAAAAAEQQQKKVSNLNNTSTKRDEIEDGPSSIYSRTYAKK